MVLPGRTVSGQPHPKTPPVIVGIIIVLVVLSSGMHTGVREQAAVSGTELLYAWLLAVLSQGMHACVQY
eukprot:1782-Rhodomonas_salina.1